MRATLTSATPTNRSAGRPDTHRPGGCQARRADAPVDTELVLIRGLPGSGKSTMAKVLALAGYEHFEADQFFTRNGTYQFDGARVRDAHAWCQRSARQALSEGRRTVVSNTFTRLREMEPYFAMSRNVRVIEATGRWGNVHSVPPETLRRMAERWEPLSS